jgi:galactose mutarotase-like enzyme
MEGSMKTIIENGILSVESKTAGAELTSIRLKADGTEYLWQADPRFWARQSPLLFPIIGAVADGKYTVAGRQYPMKNHGFARESEFEITHESAEAVAYTLVSNADTLAVYPFRFRLTAGYALDGNTLAVSWQVENNGDGPMGFSIGAHPAFNCPIAAGGSFTDYYLEFSEPETIDRQFVNAANLRIAGKREPFLRNEKIKPLTEGMFSEGAYLFDDFKSTSVALKGRKTGKSVTVSFPGFHELGIWAPPGAPFVCIEPWHGIAEATDFTGDLTQKAGVISLGVGETYRSEYKISIT